MPSEFFRVISGPAEGTTIEVNGDLEFGREAAAEGALRGDLQLSRAHARVRRTDSGSLQIEDLGSTNGTFLNGKRVEGPQPLRPGDEVSLGATKLRLIGGGRATSVGETLDDASASPDQQKTSINEQVSAPAAVGATARTGGGGATTTRDPAPFAPAPVLPSSRSDDVAHPAAGSTSKGKRGLPLPVAVLIGLVIGAAVVGIGWAADDSAAGSDVESVSLMAQGFSTETLDERTQQREINITMRTFEAPHQIQELHVHKFLDESRPPPQRTYDAIYTLIARNGDSLVLSAAGDVTEPRGPDGQLGQTFEQWRVVDGTGIFEGARGEGTVTTAVQVASRPEPAPGSNVVKHIQGDLELPNR
jgi:hypothetical protein